MLRENALNHRFGAYKVSTSKLKAEKFLLQLSTFVTTTHSTCCFGSRNGPCTNLTFKLLDEKCHGYTRIRISRFRKYVWTKSIKIKGGRVSPKHTC